MSLFVVGWALAKIAVVIVGLMSLAAVLAWMERRQSAMIQDRVGPVRANIGPFKAFGLFHPLADALKMLFKEDFVPPNADRLLHGFAPVLAFFAAIATFAVIPFGPEVCLGALGAVAPDGSGFCADATLGTRISLQIANLNVGLLFVFAIAGTGIVGAAIAGWSSDNKYSLLGGLRAASQMVSYEVTLGLSIVGCLMVYGTVRLDEMIAWQQGPLLFGWYPRWGIFVQPLAFLLFFTAAVAETKRVPFDMPEGESEIVGGYFTEYSGMKFGMFFIGEFIEVAVLSGLLTVLFFGGFDVPFLVRSGIELPFLPPLLLPHGVVVALEVLAFCVKVVLLCWLQMMVRWTIPRFRYDQVMRLGWRILLPLSLLNIAATGVAVLL